MATITLAEGGKAYPINYNLLVVLADNLPDNSAYNELAAALIDLGIPSITEKLVSRENITMKQRDALWASGNIDVRRALIDENVFLADLTDQQAHDLIADNDVEALKRVAAYSELLYPDGDNDQADRLSGEAADALIKFIRDHEDSEVRQELAENVGTPPKFLPPLRDSIKHGSRRFNLKGMTSDDMILLETASRKALENIANNIEEIQDKSLRREVGNFLASHIDPSVRLALAENGNAPISLLRLLLKDSEPDVVASAKETLLNLGEDDE